MQVSEDDLNFLHLSKPVDMTPQVQAELINGAEFPWAFGPDTSVGNMIDHLKDYVERSIKEYDCPPIQTRLKDKNSRYKAMSAMQKAIRFGDADSAQRAGQALVGSGFASTFWYRLAIMSYEDIGLPNPVLCATINVLAAEKQWRATIDERRAMFWIIEQACKAPKTRDACLLAVSPIWSPYRKDAADMQLSAWTDDKLAEAANGEHGVAKQIVAHWIIFGGAKHKWFGQTTSGKPELVKKLLAEWHIPTIVRTAQVLNYHATGDEMQLMTFYLWAMMRSSPTFEVGVDYFGPPPVEKLGNVYAATFDKHVQEGKRALGWFAKSNKPVAAWCAEHGLKAYEFVATAAFYTEGAVVDRTVHYARSKELLLLLNRMLSVGNMSLQLTLKGFELFRQQLPMLNELKTKILLSK